MPSLSSYMKFSSQMKISDLLSCDVKLQNFIDDIPAIQTIRQGASQQKKVEEAREEKGLIFKIIYQYVLYSSDRMFRKISDVFGEE